MPTPNISEFTLTSTQPEISGVASSTTMSTTSPSTTKLQGKSIYDEFVIRGIKVIDIGYIAAIYFSIGFATAMFIDYVLGPYDRNLADRKSTLRLILEAILHIWVIGVLVYIARNIVEKIPFPLDGIHGFQHSRLKEIGSASFFSFIIMFYSYNLQGRLTYLYSRFKKLYEQRKRY